MPGAVGQRVWGSGLVEGAVWPVVVVVLRVPGKRCCSVLLVDDEDAVEELAADGADEAFGDRVRPGCLDRCSDDLYAGGGEYGVEGDVNLTTISASKPLATTIRRVSLRSDRGFRSVLAARTLANNASHDDEVDAAGPC